MRGERRRPTPHLSALTHDRNRYKDKPPDFYALGQIYPEFKQYLRNIDDDMCRASLAWNDPFAVRELTKTLLLHDFGLQWNIPINRLCPPLPNRLNYIHWIEDLLREQQKPDQKSCATVISGIDVGTGASCVYALLGATLNKWRFIATEINFESYECAKENVAKNHLEPLISIKRTHTNRLLLEPLQEEPIHRQFHFVMCNPPFFDHMDEADTNPDSSCMGSANEMVFPGGEIAFIENIIIDSEVLRNRVIWYTSMVGKKSSLRKLLSLLRGKNVKSTSTTEFFQGRTKRWGIAWSFSNDAIDDLSFWASGKKLTEDKNYASRCHLSLIKVWLRLFDADLLVFSPNVPGLSEETNGCISLEEALDRIREFVKQKVELQLSIETEDYVKNTKGHIVKGLKVKCRLKMHSLGTSMLGHPSPKLSCAGRVEIFSSENNGSLEVFIIFEEGNRSAFWTMADTLQGAIVRSGRQWRRKHRHQQNDIVV
ncbi:hypothetical protein CCR75_007113 [Bremia lactucae]|uniref:U6 small nuclear RNA (adenine-(43)-N(6))-methyltransferase n=1 Tax=Bremia lactucae TaxID=4779 RepID=A0A976NZ32_BRELC|nr:hypothetical protein CCR75_007113 [Bremia lactucae]